MPMTEFDLSLIYFERRVLNAIVNDTENLSELDREWQSVFGPDSDGYNRFDDINDVVMIAQTGSRLSRNLGNMEKARKRLEMVDLRLPSDALLPEGEAIHANSYITLACQNFDFDHCIVLTKQILDKYPCSFTVMATLNGGANECFLIWKNLHDARKVLFENELVNLYETTALKCAKIAPEKWPAQYTQRVTDFRSGRSELIS